MNPWARTRLSALAGLVVAQQASFGFSYAIAAGTPIPPGRPLSACEKDIGHDVFSRLVQSGYVKGGTIAGLSYKGFKLSNSLEQKDVKAFLKLHSFTNPATIRTLAPRIKAFVRGKWFRGGTVAGIVAGGVQLIIAAGSDANAATTVGNTATEQEFACQRVDDSRFGPISDESPGQKSITDKPHPTNQDSECEKRSRQRTESEMRLKEFEKRSAEFEKRLKERFGEKYELAVLTAHYSMAKYPSDRPGETVLYSRVEVCANEKIGNSAPVLQDKIGQNDPVHGVQHLCPLFHPELMCLFDNPAAVDVIDNILSNVSYKDDELSWDMSSF
jgi:hypothetical protein